MSSVLLVRSEAERKVLGREMSLKPDAESLAADRRAWRPVVASFSRARECGLEGRWQEGTDAIEQALQQPAFKWGTARLEWPDLELWMGIALARSGDLQRHLRFCRRLAEAGRECADPGRASLAAAQVCLLLPSPAPQLLGFASNLLAQAHVEFRDESSREDRQLSRGLLAYRTGREAEVSALVDQISSSTNLHHRAAAQVLNGLAARKLGRKAEAEDALSKAKSLVPEAIESGATPARFPDLQIFLLLLDEANDRPLVL